MREVEEAKRAAAAAASQVAEYLKVRGKKHARMEDTDEPEVCQDCWNCKKRSRECVWLM